MISMNPTNLYIIIAAFSILAAILSFFLRKKINVFWAFLSVLLSGAALCMCVFANEVGIFAVWTNGNPGETVSSFLDAFVAEDYDTAYSFLEGCSDLGLITDHADENTALILETLCGSYSYCIDEPPQIEKLTATQNVQFTHLDLNAVNNIVQESTETELQKLVMERSRWEVYDDDNNYLPGITKEAYSNALKEALNHWDSYLKTETLTITLNYSDNAWRIAVNEQLIRAILGGIG